MSYLKYSGLVLKILLLSQVAVYAGGSRGSSSIQLTEESGLKNESVTILPQFWTLPQNIKK
ncbi:MAG: hypothetical protein K2P93_02550 [Alphaproteobacteria bacterium]|nr:hypothetical protein [Alphaproteobacteria bacterium]